MRLLLFGAADGLLVVVGGTAVSYRVCLGNGMVPTMKKKVTGAQSAKQFKIE